MSVGKFLAGFVIGGLVGGVFGVILAPRSGEETRDLIAKTSGDVKANTESSLKDLQAKASDVMDEIQKKGDDLLKKVQEAIAKESENANN
ncbi:MAG: YtxH domain-containing protein [bacterium]